jgi:TRAP-type C4-dicarboxylate transport system substrate-binding protein
LLINAKVFNSFTPEQQKIVREAFRKAVEAQRKLAMEAEATLRAKFEKEGVKINDLDKKPFIDAVRPVWEEYIKKNGEDGKALIEASQNP